MPARLPSPLGAYDIEIGGVPLMLARDGKPAVTLSAQLPAEADQRVPFRQQAWLWQNAGGGAGASYQSKDADATGMVEIGTDVWLRDAGVATAAGERIEIQLPVGLRGVVGRIQAVVPRWRSVPWLATGTRHLLRAGDIHNPTLVTLTEPLLSESLAVWGRALVVGGRAGRLHALWDDEHQTVLDGDIGGTATRRWLAVPNWAISNQLATGAATGQGGTIAERLVGISADGNGYYHCAAADPTVQANWSGFVRVVPEGNSDYPIVGAVQSTRVVWFSTPEGVRGASQTGYSPNFSPWVRARYDSRNGVGAVYWRNAVWYPHRDGLVMVKTDGTLQDAPVWVRFAAGVANQTRLWGRPRALCPVGDHLYVAFWDGTDSYLMALTIGSDGVPRWYGAEAVIRGQEITLVYPVDSLWLYIATIEPRTGTYDLGTGVMHLWKQRLPYSDSPVTDVRLGYSWQAQSPWQVVLPRLDHYSTDPKTVQRVDVVAAWGLTENPGIGAAGTAAIEVSADDGPWQAVGTATGATRFSSPPLDAPIEGATVQARLTMQNSPFNPVILRSASIWTTADPELATVKHYRVVIDGGATLRHRRGKEDRDPRRVVEELVSLQGRPSVPMTDELGVARSVRLEPGLRATLLEREEGRGWVALVELDVAILREATFARDPDLPPIDPPPPTTGVPRYDAGFAYDTGQGYRS